MKSALFSPSDIQSIMKKAIVERLKSVYGISWFQEDGASFPIRVAFMKDVATIGIDTSGVSLHKRGYRQMTVKAPITETLASALIMLTPWNKDLSLIHICKDAHEAVHNAVVLEEVAKMACRCELINPQVKPAPQELQDKHYYRKHGANAYYGQIKR